MKKKYILKNLSFVKVTERCWWTKHPADFEIMKSGELFLIFSEGFHQGKKISLQSAKRYCRKLYLKDVEKYLQEVK